MKQQTAGWPLRGTERATPLDREYAPKAYRHVSLHARPDDARQTLDRLLAGHLGRGGSTEEVSVTVAQRTVGDLAIGNTHHEQAPERHCQVNLDHDLLY
ncbi:MAG TPA: hypothetical protein VIY28_10325 [Pseudonocardiaceae bacterium]